MDEHSRGATDGVQRLEGYLLWQAEVLGAERAAVAFADRLPWLTTAQREVVEQAYAQERLLESRQTVTHIARRCRTIRGEYEERYRQLKMRAVALVLGCFTLAAAASVLLAVRPVRW
ncbi:cytochrome C oxidase subunit I [Kitasatospora sp. NPDC004240]